MGDQRKGVIGFYEEEILTLQKRWLEPDLAEDEGILTQGDHRSKRLGGVKRGFIVVSRHWDGIPALPLLSWVTGQVTEPSWGLLAHL